MDIQGIEFDDAINSRAYELDIVTKNQEQVNDYANEQLN